MSEEDFNEENIPASSWMKFTKVGDYIKGTFVEKSIKPASGDFKEQTVYKLVNCETMIDGSKQDESEFSVGVSSRYVIERLQHAKPGQRVGLKFEKSIPAKVKGHHDAKSIMPNLWGMDPDYKDPEEESFEE